MSATLNRKLRRDLAGSWKMLLAVTAIIAVGIGCFSGMLAASRNLQGARGHYYSACRFGEFWIDLKKAPVEEVRRLAHIPGISEVRDRLQFRVIVDLPGVDEPVSARVLSLPGDPVPVINGVIMRSGSYFSPGRPNEVIVSEKFAAAREIGPGDRLDIIMNGRREELVVAGTAISAEFVYLTSPGSLVDDPKNYGLFYLKRGFLEDTFGFEGACNSVTGLLAPEVALDDDPAVVRELARRLAPFGVAATTPRADQFSHLTLSSEMQQLRTMAWLFPMFFLVVAVLVLNVLMSRIAEQQRTVLGTFKALGYGDRELLGHFVSFGAAAGLMGGLLGGAIGYWMSGAMTGMYEQFFSFPRLTNAFYPGLLLAGGALSVAACAAGTYLGVRGVVRLLPAESMRPKAPGGGGGGVFLERWRALWGRLGTGWQMVLRGVLRRPLRSAVGVVSAAFGAAIVVLAFGFVDSMDRLIGDQFGKVLRSDYHLTFGSELDREVVDEVKRLPGVWTAEPVFASAVTFEHGHARKEGGVLGIAPGSRLTVPRDGSGRPVRPPPTGLLMAERLMDQLGVAAGGQVTLRPVRGLREPVAVAVAGAFPSMLGLDVYADYTWLNRVVGESASVSEVRVAALQSPAERRAFMRALKTMPHLEAVTDIGEQKRALQVQFDGAMRATAVIMICFAAVIFFGAIINSTLISIAERTREIATFSALGYTDGETAGLFLRENLLVNFAGALLGLPLGTAMLNWMVDSFQTDAYSIPVALSTSSYLYTLALAVVFVLAAQLAVRRSVSRIDRVRALNQRD